MYCVQPETFKEFLNKKGIQLSPFPELNSLPCIVMFKDKDILMGKVETIDREEIQQVLKGLFPDKPVNKYWIRGQEWKHDENGELIEKLEV